MYIRTTSIIQWCRIIINFIIIIINFTSLNKYLQLFIFKCVIFKYKNSEDNKLTYVQKMLQFLYIQYTVL